MSQKLLVIDGWEVPKIIKFDTTYSKIWADDTGRDMAGENKGTLIGVFPKINVEVGEYTQGDMQVFLSAANKPTVELDWYDEEEGVLKKGLSYSIAEYSISLKDAKRMKYISFSFELIPNKARESS